MVRRGLFPAFGAFPSSGQRWFSFPPHVQNSLNPCEIFLPIALQKRLRNISTGFLPAGASMQLFGVYSEELVEPLAHVLHNLGCKRAMTIYGMDSIDEISLSADTKVCEFKNDEFKSYTIKPEDFGFTRCKKEDLAGGEPAVNARIARDILEGAEGPKTDVVLLNAGAAIYLASDGITMKEGIEKAREIIKSGAAKKQLERFIEETNK